MKRAFLSLISRRPFACLLFLLMFALLATPKVYAQQQPDFDAVAAKVSAVIQRSSKNSSGPISVLVIEFEEKNDAKSELGPELASEFADALRTHEQDFRVVHLSELQRGVANLSLSKTAVLHPSVLKCYAPDLGLSYVVDGTMEYGPDGVVVRIETRETRGLYRIFEEMLVLPLSPAMKQLAAKPVPLPPPFFTQEEKVWVNPNLPPVSDDAVADPKKTGPERLYPSCLFCPRAEFSEEALRARLQGTVTLLVRIPPEGAASKISLVRGLPCGLSDRAFEAVERWRFKPATKSDGTPVTVDQLVEVTFHFY